MGLLFFNWSPLFVPEACIFGYIVTVCIGRRPIDNEIREEIISVIFCGVVAPRYAALNYGQALWIPRVWQDRTKAVFFSFENVCVDDEMRFRYCDAGVL